MSDYIPSLKCRLITSPSHIPEEIEADILKLLSVKTLLRFRSVCKRWKHFIDSPFFIQHHLSLQNPQFLVKYKYPEEFLVSDLSSSSSSHTLPAPNQHLLGTLHGIVSLFDDHDDDDYGLVSLWNPSLRKLSTLPSPPFLHSLWEGDPGVGTTYSAFWIDPSTKHFKILLFKLMAVEDVANDGTIFSSVTGSWTQLALDELADLQPLRECPPILIQGVAYWTSCYDLIDNQERIVGMDVVLISFHFGLERFEIVEAPSVEYIGWGHPVVCSWRGTLSLVYLDNSNLCDVYVRRDGLWVNLFCFKLASDIRGVHWVLGEMEDDGGVLVEERRNKMFASSEHELVLCDTRGGRVPVKSGLVESFDCFVANGFVESLLFPEGLELIMLPY